MKWSSVLLTPILTKLINKCFLGGIHPDKLKLARVIPIFKGGGSKNESSLYRPISILTQINRIFERLLRDTA